MRVVKPALPQRLRSSELKTSMMMRNSTMKKLMKMKIQTVHQKMSQKFPQKSMPVSFS